MNMPMDPKVKMMMDMLSGMTPASRTVTGNDKLYQSQGNLLVDDPNMIDVYGQPRNEAAVDILEEEMGALSPMEEAGMYPAGTERRGGNMMPFQSDEELLEYMQNNMGGGPPAGSGMKWEDVDADRRALEANPSEDNIAAFIEYWGEEELPDSLMPPGGDTGGEE